MIDMTAFLGEPLDFGGKLKIYPPKVKDVITNPYYSIYYSLLATSAEDIQDELKKSNAELDSFPTPFEFLLINAYHHPEIKQKTIEAFEFFCHTSITLMFNEKKIMIGDAEQVVKEIETLEDIQYLEEEEFFAFQNKIRLACGMEQVKPPEPFDPNEDPRIRKIKERARERDRIKAKQGGKNGISLNAVLTAICCMGIGITPLNIGEMSYAAVNPIMKMMQEKEKYDIDIRSLLAGADSKKIKPKYWIRNSNE